ncbi:glucose 1-dehydrogenase [Nitratireductor mangrovi]|uniref:Glucose 1-dehydrogenase n=1 Tax=Nitratireductor mangrovi TaxID=2599600 RepID=A0A5B8L2S5_9HYPH|nr:glucose 1-dehydrogenase [Nitratireductor mangrovi]QDZ02274.1 glucose 1-dehydrogenase [Nitratireductor mangrovi]
MSDPIPAVSKLLDLSGRTAIVTGASGGIGSGIAKRFGEAGAHVICHYHSNEDAAETVAAGIRSAGGKATASQADVASARDIAALIENAGNADILVNNAGIQPVKSFIDLSESDWGDMMEANLAGPFLLVRAFADALRKSGKGGSVVNIASIEAHNPAPGHGHYATSKAALLMFTKAAAMELGAYGIRVNSISPGLIHRDGIEDGWPEGVERWKKAAALGRLGRPEDIADAALFLASDAARWITGTDIIVDGGVMARPTW